MTRRRGRPPKPEQERLAAPLTIRLTEEEYEATYRQAVRARLPVAVYVRRALRAAINSRTH